MRVPVLLLCSLLVSPILIAQEETFFSVTVKIDVSTDAETNGLSVGVLDELSGATGFAGLTLR